MEAEVSTIADNIRRSDPDAIYSYGVSVRPLREAGAGDAREYLSLLMAAVLLVLLLACANLAGLSLARGRDRAGEIGVRLALVVSSLLANWSPNISRSHQSAERWA